MRIGGGRGDALYKSTVDIDIDIDITGIRYGVYVRQRHQSKPTATIHRKRSSYLNSTSRGYSVCIRPPRLTDIASRDAN